MDMLNRPVSHLKFGAGVIKSCENGTLQVYFLQYGARFFHYPEAFDKFLTTDDEALAIQVAADLSTWKASRDIQEEQLTAAIEATMKQARTVKKPATRRRSTTPKAAK